MLLWGGVICLLFLTFLATVSGIGPIRTILLSLLANYLWIVATLSGFKLPASFGLALGFGLTFTALVSPGCIIAALVGWSIFWLHRVFRGKRRCDQASVGRNRYCAE